MSVNAACVCDVIDRLHREAVFPVEFSVSKIISMVLRVALIIVYCCVVNGSVSLNFNISESDV